MSSTRRFLSLVLLMLAFASVAVQAQTSKKTKNSTPTVPSDGTVTGALTVNGEKFPLTHVYGRKREAWPADAKELEAETVENLSCGIVELIFTNQPLTEATLTSILSNDYRGSDKIRGVRLIVDGSGQYKYEKMFLLESGAVTGFGMTQSSGEFTGGRRFAGKVSCKNEEVTQVRMYDLSFDTGVQLQYTRTETESSERVAESRLSEEFLKVLPGEWTVERWLGLSCTTASGKLVVTDRVSPRTFRGMLYLTLSNGHEIEEDFTISVAGDKIHFEGGKVNKPDVWGKDVLDLELWQGLLIGNNATDFVVLRKNADAAAVPGAL